MFDFRYHAISLVAVLVALVVGVLLGVAIGDAGLVSSAEQNLRADLREDVGRAQDRASDLESKLGEQQRRARRYEQATYPLLVGGRLEGRRVALVFLGTPSRAVRDDVSDALDHTGGRLAGTLGVREAPTSRRSPRPRVTRGADLERDPKLLEDFGRRIGVQLFQGGKPPRSEAEAAVLHARGLARPVRGRRHRAQPVEGPHRRGVGARRRAGDGIVKGLTETPGFAAGVERSGSTPSQVPVYRSAA